MGCKILNSHIKYTIIYKLELKMYENVQYKIFKIIVEIYSTVQHSSYSPVPAPLTAVVPYTQSQNDQFNPGVLY